MSSEHRGASGSPPVSHRLVDRISLKVLLVGAMLLLVLAGLTISGAAVAVTMRAQLIEQVDGQLREASGGWVHRRPLPPGAAGPGAEQPSPQSSPEAGSRLAERANRERPPSQFYVRETGYDGQILLTVNDFGSAPAIPDSPPTGTPLTVPSAGEGGQWRIMALPTASGTTVLGVPLDRQVDRTVNLLIIVSAVVGTVVLLLVGLAGWYLVARSLRPLREVEAAAEEIAAGNLHRRLPPRPENTEVGGLTHSFNEMVNRIQNAFATARDSEAAALDSEAAARKSEERTREFAADASHELRTPLTSIRGFAELHRMGAMPDAEAALAKIETEAVRMSTLVEDLLSLARLDNEVPLELAPVDVAEVATDAVATVRAIDPKKRIDVEVRAVPVAPADAGKIRQVLSNLLVNACRHTPASARVRVLIDREEADGAAWAIVVVSDDGDGMSPEDAERVFERFHRADASRTRAQGGGSGLGLSIAKGLVEAHGGTIDLDTAPGEGATFTVRLPAQ